MYLREILDICESVFTNPFINEFAGSKPVCRFCGAGIGMTDHAKNCPVSRFVKHREKALIEFQSLEEVAESSLNCLFHGRKPTKDEFSRAAKAFRDLELAQMPPAGSP